MIILSLIKLYIGEFMERVALSEKTGTPDYQTEIKQTPKSKSVCEKLGLKSALFGMFGAIATVPLGNAAAYLAQKIGLVPSMAEQLLRVKQSLIDEAAGWGVTLDAEAVMQSSCPRENLLLQYNAQLPPERQLSFFRSRANGIYNNCLMGPIGEEFLFRHCFQNIALTYAIKSINKKLSVNRQIPLDHVIVKAARIVFTAAVFSASHLLWNGGAMTNQVAAAFTSGIVFGIFQESRLGLHGAIGAHIANNLWTTSAGKCL